MSPDADARSQGTAPEGPAAVQSNEQWMMRLNREGLPMCKDLHGLFTTMLISLSDRWPDWRFSLAFVLPAAVQRMQALQFVQIVRDSAGGMHNMLSLSQIKTSFIMSTETAWRICQAFIDACLMERLPRSDGEVYAPTPKGLHLVDRFVTRHGIATRSVSNLLNVHEVCDKLLFLERDDQDDVLLSDAVVRIVFHRLVGLGPDRSEASALGLAMEPTQVRDASGALYKTAKFSSFDALSWLVNYTTLVSMDEAAVLLAHMVRLGWIEAQLGVPPEQSNRVAAVRIEDATLSDGEAREGTFVEGDIYHVTEKGASVAWHVDWDESELSHDAPPRPPTSMSDAQKAHEMHAVSPRIDTSELYDDYTSRNPYASQRAVSPTQSPIQHLSPYMGMSPLPNVSPLAGESPLPKSSPLAGSSNVRSSAAPTEPAPSGGYATGLGLGLGPEATEARAGPSVPHTTVSPPEATARSTAPAPARVSVPRPAADAVPRSGPSTITTSVPVDTSAPASASSSRAKEGTASLSNSDVPSTAPVSAALASEPRESTPTEASLPQPAPAISRSGTTTSRATTAATAVTSASRRTTSVSQDPQSLAHILHTPKLRRAFAAFLAACNNVDLLRLWCQVEWFRNDCRVASSGTPPAPPASDPVAELPSRSEVRGGTNGPTERSMLREILENRARTRLAPFVAPEAAKSLELDVTSLAQALRTYTEPSARALPGSPEAARESEVQLAQLLVQCAAVQKQVYTRLAEQPRRQFLAARGEL